MSETISGLVLSAVIIGVGLITFHVMVSIWDGQGYDAQAAFEVHEDRLNTSMSIGSASAADLDCNTFTGTIANNGDTSVADFSEMDVLVDYTDPTDAKVSGNLLYGTDWSVASISPDTGDPNIWDPGETATLSFSLSPALKSDKSGVVSVGMPGGETDMAYLRCSLNYFLYSQTSTISATIYHQLGRSAPAAGTSATTSATSAAGQTGRVRPASNNGKFVFPLTGLTELAAADWTVGYRVKRNDPATSTLSGTKIAFTSDRDGDQDVYVMDHDGSNVTNLTDNATSDDRPAWSPDGLKIAFAANRDGNWEVYVMDADGANQTNLTSNAAEDRFPA